MIQPTVITTAGSLTVLVRGEPVAVVRAVPFSRGKCRYFFEWMSNEVTVVRSKEGARYGAEARA